MGFPLGYPVLLVPRVFLNVAFVFGFIRTAVCWLLRLMGFSDFLESEATWPDEINSTESSSSISAQRIRGRLPIIKFSVLAEAMEDHDVMCAVCLNIMERQEEVRMLMSCSHIFHRRCLDKWVDYGQKTCPLCRSPFLSDIIHREMKEELRTSEHSSNLFGNVSADQMS